MYVGIYGFFQFFDMVVWNGDVLIQVGGVQFFVCEKGVVDDIVGNVVIVFEQQVDLFEQVFFVVGFQFYYDIGCRQEFGNLVYVWGLIGCCLFV